MDPWLYGVITVLVFALIQIFFGLLARYRFRRHLRRIEREEAEAAAVAAEPPPSYEQADRTSVQPLPPPPRNVSSEWSLHMGTKVQVNMEAEEEEDALPSYEWAVTADREDGKYEVV